MNEEIGISIQSACYACNLSGERFAICQDEMDANDTARAWEIVDEGNMQYTFTLSHVQSDPSGHDWVSSVTRRADKSERHEYAPTSVKIDDGLDELTILRLNLDELDDETQRSREVECHWCHLMTPKQFNDCQDCDMPLESNVR